jgi:hypothetical protein
MAHEEGRDTGTIQALETRVVALHAARTAATAGRGGGETFLERGSGRQGLEGTEDDVGAAVQGMSRGRGAQLMLLDDETFLWKRTEQQGERA